MKTKLLITLSVLVIHYILHLVKNNFILQNRNFRPIWGVAQSITPRIQEAEKRLNML